MKKRNLFILILLTTALVFEACGSGSTIDSETETAVAAEQEQVTISYGLWGGDAREEYTMEQIEAFEEKYPYITVEVNYTDWDTIDAEIEYIMGDGRESDVMQINYDWLERFSSDGNGFYDLNQLSDIIQLDAYSDLSLSLGEVDGKLNALTVAMNTAVPVYNKTMYDYYGLDLPESVEDLYAAAEVMKGDQVYQLGLQDNQLILLLFGCYENTYGVSVVDAEGNLNISDEGYAYLAETYKSFLDDYIVYPYSEYTDTRIEGNRVAGVICWINSIEKYKTIISDAGDVPEVGKFLWTDTDERSGNYYRPSMMMAISANTEHPKEAAMLLDFLLNDRDAVSPQGVEKGTPDSRYAQQILMEDGSLNNDTFHATLRMNYYMEYMHVLPTALEDEDNIISWLTVLDSYVDGSRTLDETVASLKVIR